MTNIPRNISRHALNQWKTSVSQNYLQSAQYSFMERIGFGERMGLGVFGIGQKTIDATWFEVE